ncbi:MAG: KpsF/GutQ family sugar-phosphate isomerase [Pseudomonadota bacterium]
MSMSTAARVIPISDDLDEARRVLKLEAAALLDSASSLDQSFVEAVGCLDLIQGRIVVTGMGKSGHIARKIAATLASTGTPAIFVHPAEANHGDLGMITSQDAVIAFSHSGETAELSHIIRYTRRYQIPLLAVAGDANSTLAQSADITIKLPELQEACPIGLAPTTSTTVMLALGDALACALLTRKNFSAQDFGIFHPSGSLGRRLLTVCDIMHTGDKLPIVDMATVVSKALLVITEKSLGCVGIVDATRKLIGVITDGDLRRHMGSDLLERNVTQIMSPTPKTIRPNALVVEALAEMNQHGITGLFVASASEVLGFVHVHDCLRET